MKKKIDSVTSNREYNILLKKQGLYCYICARRAGRYDVSCCPRPKNRIREFRTWKHNRKTQYKIK